MFDMKGLRGGGSSPRMRGAQTLAPVHPYYMRIIPADAGSTNAVILTIPGNRDHPRGCGEHAPSRPLCPVIWGSSPRMRGAPLRSWHSHITDRIIPADAGSTMEHTLDVGLVGDHPRGCGEHHRVKYGAPEEEGSSPRMRGALRDGRSGRCQPGIIPADAGSTPGSKA